MRKLSYFFSLCILMCIVLVSCSKSELDNLTPESGDMLSAKTTGRVKSTATSTIGGYSFGNFINVEGNTWTVDITHAGAEKDISHLLIAFNKTCLDFDAATLTATSASIHGRTLTIKPTEGTGSQSCTIPSASYFKIEGFVDGDVKGRTEAVTLTFTLNQKMGVEVFGVTVKAGSTQSDGGCFAGTVAGPGCPITEGCSMSQGFYFASKNSAHIWAKLPKNSNNEPVLTVGGASMTEAVARNTFRSSKKTAAQKAFFQAGAIILSSSSVSSTASVMPYVDAVKTFLKDNSKLNSNDKSMNSAAGAIGNWIDANHCEE